MDTRPYVFISYAHLDLETVMPCINALKQSGVNLWYDEGIQAGSEWPEFIAEKVVSCTKFVLFISKSYLNSQNCKRELNFAISRKKDILSIFLEDVVLSPGVEMQLGTYQAIYRNRFSSLSAFLESLCKEHFFDSCRVNKASNTAPNSNAVPNSNTVPKKQPTPNGAPFVQAFKKAIPNTPPKATTHVQQPTNTIEDKIAYASRPLKNRFLAAFFAIIFGCVGGHKFYLGQLIRGFIYLIFWWTFIPCILGIVEGITILCCNNQKFEKKYKCRVKKVIS